MKSPEIPQDALPEVVCSTARESVLPPGARKEWVQETNIVADQRDERLTFVLSLRRVGNIPEEQIHPLEKVLTV